MAGRKSHYSYWGSLPQFREDGTRLRHRIDYERIPIPNWNDVEWDLTLEECWTGDSAKRLAARKRVWRRIRCGYYDNGRHAPTANTIALTQTSQLCGARCRDGHRCRARSVVNKHTGNRSARCKWHGGHSTGPRTEAGKAASLAALARGRATRSRGHG